MAIIGSHDTMTYLSANNLIYKLFSFTWRCQKHDITEQFINGARCFDIRLKYHNNEWHFAHGRAIFDENVIDTFNTLNKLAVVYTSKIYIRLILEETSENIDNENKFIEFAQQLVNKYTPNLIFFEGTRKFDWKRLIIFDFYKDVIQYVGSMQSWYGKICPWLYWKINHKRNEEKIKSLSDTDIVLIDFI